MAANRFTNNTGYTIRAVSTDKAGNTAPCPPASPSTHDQTNAPSRLGALAVAIAVASLSDLGPAKATSLDLIASKRGFGIKATPVAGLYPGATKTLTLRVPTRTATASACCR